MLRGVNARCLVARKTVAGGTQIEDLGNLSANAGKFRVAQGIRAATPAFVVRGLVVTVAGGDAEQAVDE